MSDIPKLPEEKKPEEQKPVEQPKNLLAKYCKPLAIVVLVLAVLLLVYVLFFAPFAPAKMSGGKGKGWGKKRGGCGCMAMMS